MKTVMIVVKILIFGALFIISNQNLHLADSVEREVFLDTYGAWITHLVGQGVDVTGYVVKFEWLPPKDSEELNRLVSGQG